MNPFCAYGSAVDPTTDPYLNPDADNSDLVVFCNNDGTRAFNWPLPGGGAGRVQVCLTHSRVLADLCERTTT